MTTEARRVRFADSHIEMAHGAGGKATRRLVEGLFLPLLANSALESLADAGTVEFENARLAVTTDSFVVRPLDFPGGCIGELAVNGTVNDLAVSGARPLALAVSLVLEAGLSTEILRRQIEGLARAARAAGVCVVAGDTKVVENGKADGMYITTTGLGLVEPRLELGADRVRPGDRILVSGPIGDHGITILLARGELELEAELQTDSRSVYALVQALAEDAAPALKWMRDPTRGGVASALNELARDARIGVALFEEKIPLRRTVRGACEILGLDPLHIACEGQFLAVVAAENAESAAEALRRAGGGSRPALIGEIRQDPPGMLVCETAYGGRRVVDMLIGDPLPRIC